MDSVPDGMFSNLIYATRQEDGSIKGVVRPVDFLQFFPKKNTFKGTSRAAFSFSDFFSLFFWVRGEGGGVWSFHSDAPCSFSGGFIINDRTDSPLERSIMTHLDVR